MLHQDSDMAGELPRRRDALAAITAGTLIGITLNVWYRLAGPETIDGHMWLVRIHEPPTWLAERLFYTLYPKIGNPWSLWCAVAAGYIVLASMWILPAFGMIKAARGIATLDLRFRRLFLLSVGISAAGYLGLAVTGAPVYSPFGMAWSAGVLVVWLATIAITFRHCGMKSLWLLLEAPVVLLPFYRIFLVDI